jgi:peptidyl-prolyl cis-trans isomerase C
MRYCLVILGCMLAAAASGEAPDLRGLDIVERSVPDGPVALIEGAPVSREDFMTLYQTRIAGLGQQQSAGAAPDSVRVRAALRTLGELLQRELLYREAESRNITVSQAEIDEAWNRKIARLRQQFTRPGEEAPAEAELLEKADQTLEEARDNVRKTLMVLKARDALAKELGVSVTEADIRKFYDERRELFAQPESVHIRQLFIRPLPNAQEADEEAWRKAAEKIEKALARIRAGEQFAAVAKDMSDAADRAQGGDLGMAPADRIPPFYREALQAMEPGDLSGVIRSEHGLHLIQFIDETKGEQVPFEKAKGRIRALLMDVKTEDALADYCETFIDDPEKVKIFLQLERTLAALGDGRGEEAGDT